MGTTRTKRSRTRVNVEQNVYELSRERVHYLYENFDTVAVAFSGGKDSTATLNVVIEVARELDRLPVRTIFYDEEAIPYETEHYVRRVGLRPEVDLEWYCIPFIGNNHCSRKNQIWYPWDPTCPEKWVRPMPPEAITAEEISGFSQQLHTYEVNALLFDPKTDGNTALCLGIRTQESITRLRAVTRKVNENYINKYTETTDRGNLWRAYPIYDWRTSDVWTAVDKFGWDHNSAYDIMEMAGLAHLSQRCSPPYANEPLQKLWTYAVCFPDVWEKMVDRVDGAAAAARYAKTELYGFRTRPKKPDGVSWEAWLTTLLKQWPDQEARANVADRLREEISKHFLKTSDPLVVFAPHPLSGVSWDFLAMIAMRGDDRNRKSPLVRVSQLEKMPEYWKKYNAERAELESRNEIW